ncbi:unnamed protein product [Spirodela intermedia]|uniref:Uncharacterized protein n=1 Tax=Spirodela intermedia TaxID=51605 RepID=A0A7I8LBY4_SPIIN|nr:unnamed protein product [Spirodela intermedia]
MDWRCPRGPTPLRSSSWGLPRAPADRITSPPARVVARCLMPNWSR